MQKCLLDSALETAMPRGIWSNESAKKHVVGNPPDDRPIIRFEDGALYLRELNERWGSQGQAVVATSPLTLEAELHRTITTAEGQPQCKASMTLALQQIRAEALHFVLISENEDCVDGMRIRTGELTPDPAAEQRRREDQARLKALGYTVEGPRNLQ